MADLSQIVAIDVHTHVSTSVNAPPPERPSEGAAAMARYFRQEGERATTVPDIAAYYRERNMMCVTFTVDSSTISGNPPSLTNEEVAEQAAENADVVIPFASLDPHLGKLAVNAAKRLIEEHHVKGFKFHPNGQAFFPNDPAYYPLYQVFEEHQVPALFHTGQTAVGAGTRGGSGIRLKYSNPMFLDDVAVDFPDLTIIMAHPSVPWQDEACSVALHKPNVYIDLSGWSPKYFPAQLVQYSNTLLRNKVLFGSDYPGITPDRWMADFETIAIRDEVRPLILKDNAVKLFGLDAAA